MALLQRFFETIKHHVQRARGLEMHIDVLSADVVSGWARNPHNISHRPFVEVKSGDTLLGSASAGNFRQDLLAADIGDGCYGFAIAPRLSSFNSDPTPVDVYIDGNKIVSDAVKPTYDKVMTEFAADIEQRMDALLAIYKERTDREIADLIRQHQA